MIGIVCWRECVDIVSLSMSRFSIVYCGVVKVISEEILWLDCYVNSGIYREC